MVAWSLSLGPSSLRLPPRKRGRQLQKGLQPYACATLGGMLSSSCCLLQLALNSMSFGCAGFSSLTPYRPLFLLLTAAGLAYEHTLHRSARRSAAAVALALCLTVTPQLVELYNRLPGSRPRLPWPSPPQRQQQPAVSLRVEGVKCESCAARVKGAVLADGAAGVESCTVDFKAGLLTVAGRDVSLPAVRRAVAGLGYELPEDAGRDRPPQESGRPAAAAA